MTDWDHVPIRILRKFTLGDGCWEWTASTRRDGYGQVYWQGRPRVAHRVLYELVVGPVPPGLQLDHLCRVRHCVRPDHLEPVTHQENIRRSNASGSRARQTHCKRGHDLALARVDGLGHRVCLLCRRVR